MASTSPVPPQHTASTDAKPDAPDATDAPDAADATDATDAAEATGDQPGAVGELVAAVKPRLRGWLHAGTFPLALAAGLVLSILAPDGRPKVGAIVFTVTAALLFGTSAVYHRGNWSSRANGVLKRLDHSNIFLIIAGSYTPFALTLLPWDQARTLLVVVWIGAVGGVLFRTLWVGAPRWLYTPIYVALGWVAAFYFSPLLHFGGPAIVTLIAVGGLLYTLGAVVYGTKRPNPSPRWFGFHEIFHALTVLAFVAHYVAASLAVYGVGVLSSGSS